MAWRQFPIARVAPGNNGHGRAAIGARAAAVTEDVMPGVALVLELDLVPGRKDAFLARAIEHRETVKRNEPGCRHFDVLVSEDAPDRVFLYAVYTNRSALETHFSTSYTQHFLDGTKPMVAERRLNLCGLAHG